MTHFLDVTAIAVRDAARLYFEPLARALSVLSIAPLRVHGDGESFDAKTATASASPRGDVMIDVRDVVKTYRRDLVDVPVLSGISFKVNTGEFLAVLGPSGSGKTTLLQLIAGLDRPTRGTVAVAGVPLPPLDESDLAKWRAARVGLIFQMHHLIPTLTALENVETPLLLTSLSPRARRRQAEAALALVGLSDRIDYYPRALSGGQEQRVAIARAMVTDPEILLVDEPTGELDATNSDEILNLLRSLSRDLGKTIIMATHDPKASQYASRVLHLVKGALTESWDEGESFVGDRQRSG